MDKDGINGTCCILNGDQFNVPAEVSETRFPLMVERYELIQDSGGAGGFRGGLGLRKDYRVVKGQATVSCSMDRWKFAPPGLQSGKPGARNTCLIYPETDREVNASRVGGITVEEGGLISHRTGGGGGFGDPFARSVTLVRDDVLDGYISIRAAAEDYGVAVDQKTGKVDLAATEHSRRSPNQ
jgi:N-methylhydantoinase B